MAVIQRPSPKIIPAAHLIIPSAAAALQAFFADIYAEACKARPGLGHRALAQVAGAHKLLRHYTMNIDGLAEAAGMDTWHVDNNPAGQPQLPYLPFCNFSPCCNFFLVRANV